MGCRCLLLPSSFFLIFNCTRGLPRWLSGKESACQCRSLRRCWFVPGSGRSAGEGHGNLLQYSCLENNTMDRGAWRTEVHGIAKSPTQLSDWACTHVTVRRGMGVCVWIVCAHKGLCVSEGGREERGWWHRTFFSVPMAGITQAAHFSQGWLWWKPPYKFQKFLAWETVNFPYSKLDLMNCPVTQL